MTEFGSFWDGDINEATIDEWTDTTTPFDRVKDVLLETTTHQYATAIAERARVSEPTARNHLETLAEAGYAETDTTGRGTTYKRSRETVAMERIQALHADVSKDELVAGIQDLKSKLNSYQSEYEVMDPDDLALDLAAEDSEGWAAISRWRALEENLKVAQAALSLYDFDPDSDGGQTESDSDSRRDFGRDTGSLSA